MRTRRHLPLDGALNLRDVGGYRTIDGRRTRWRTLLRSDSLHRLSTTAQAELVAYGVRSVVDLRRPAEAAADPCMFAGAQVPRYVQLPMGNDPLVLDVGASSEDFSVAEVYRLAAAPRQEPLRQVMAFLAAPGSLPAVVHCTAGRDRTGLVIALALAVAGVPSDAIARDYALSRRYLGDDRLRCSALVMLETLAWIEDTYGGVSAYLGAAGVLATELARLREVLTAGAG